MYCNTLIQSFYLFRMILRQKRTKTTHLAEPPPPPPHNILNEYKDPTSLYSRGQFNNFSKIDLSLSLHDEGKIAVTMFKAHRAFCLADNLFSAGRRLCNEHLSPLNNSEVSMNSNPSTRAPSVTLETSKEAVNELLILNDSLKRTLSTCKVL